MAQLETVKQILNGLPPLAETMDLSPEEKELIERMQTVAKDLASCDLGPLERKLNAALSQPESESEKKTAAAAKTAFPNIAYEMIRIGLRVEARSNKELDRHAKEAGEIQKTIEKLIDLSGHFSEKAKGSSEKELSEKITALCSQLKEQGIEIFSGDLKKLKEEQIVEIKAKIGAHTDRLKTDLQIKFTTEIQVKINELHSILDCLKTIEKYASRLNETIIANQRGGH